jgi:hypothetical protein
MNYCTAPLDSHTHCSERLLGASPGTCAGGRSSIHPPDDPIDRGGRRAPPIVARRGGSSVDPDDSDDDALSALDVRFRSASVCTAMVLALAYYVVVKGDHRTLSPWQLVAAWAAIYAFLFTQTFVPPSLRALHGGVGEWILRLTFYPLGYGLAHCYDGDDLEKQKELVEGDWWLVRCFGALVALLACDVKYFMCFNMMGAAGWGWMRGYDRMHLKWGRRFLVASAAFLFLCIAFWCKVILEAAPMLTFLVRGLQGLGYLVNAAFLLCVVDAIVFRAPDDNDEPGLFQLVVPAEYPPALPGRELRPPPVRRPRGWNRWRVYRGRRR